MNSKEIPLVSIVVISYNSSKYILETLESAKNQIYQNIELIISDDGSNDDTIDLCEKWLKQNKTRFVNTKLIHVKKNTGIPANCNRGIQTSIGEWIKLIAGDDLLYPECTNSNLDYLLKNPKIEILQTKSSLFKENIKMGSLLGFSPIIKNNDFFDLGSKEQFQLLLKKNFIIAPSIMFSKKLYNDVGGFDEDFKFFEDITFWLNLTQKGYKIYFLNIPTVYYRKHDETSEKRSKPFMGEHYARELIKFRKKYTNEHLDFVTRNKYLLRLKSIIFFDRIGLNNHSFVSKFLYKSLNKVLR